MKTETVGKTIVDQYSRQQHEAELGELLPKEHERYFAELEKGLELGKSRFNGDFYIEFVLKKERLMPQILPRMWAISRSTCPTPFYDQTVFLYNKKDDVLEFVWSLPDPDTFSMLKANALNLSSQDRELLQYILDYSDGTLLKLAKRLNGEREDSVLLV